MSPQDTDTPVEATNNEEKPACIKADDLQEKLKVIKKNLATVVNSIGKNPSLFTRASAFWAKLSLWLKLIIGAVLVGPLLAAGIMANIPVLITIAVFFAVIYATCYCLFENHHKHRITLESPYIKGLNGIVELIGEVMTTLDLFSKQLDVEIKQLQQKNIKLTESLDELTQDIDHIAIQDQKLTETGINLGLATTEAQETVSACKASVADQENLIRVTKNELIEIKQSYEEIINKLSQHIVELEKETEDVNQAFSKSQLMAYSLQDTIVKLSTLVLEEDKQNSDFHKKLDDILSKFDKTVTGICKTGRELEQAKEESKANNRKHKELLERNSNAISNLEQITSQGTLNNSASKPSQGGMFHDGARHHAANDKTSDNQYILK